MNATNYQGRRSSDRTDNTPFCQPLEMILTDIPLTVRKDKAAALLNIPEFRAIDTIELIFLARKRGVHTVDRAAAIAVLQGARTL